MHELVAHADSVFGANTGGRDTSQMQQIAWMLVLVPPRGFVENLLRDHT